MRLNKLIMSAVVAASVLIVSSCARKVTRIDPNQQIDISGGWNNTDARLVAEQATSDILSASWLTNHLSDHAGKKPVVIVGMVYNKSHEHI